MRVSKKEILLLSVVLCDSDYVIEEFSWVFPQNKTDLLLEEILLFDTRQRCML